MDEPESQGASAPIVNEIRTGGLGKKYKYKSLRNLSNTVVVLAALNCFSILALIAALRGQAQLLQRMGAHLFQSQQEMISAATQSDGVVRLLSLLFLLTLISTYIAGGMWIYRAACNVRAGGARGLQYTPGWAVGWYCIPLMALFKPFGAMVEIWNGSYSPEGWKRLPAPGLLRWWWGAWIAVNLVGASVNGVSKLARTLPELIFVTQFRMIDGAIDLVGTLLFMVVVLRIARLQAEASATISDLAAAFS